MKNKIIKELTENAKNNKKFFSVHWEITNNCNLSCKHCFIPSRGENIDLTDCSYILDELVNIGVFPVTISGGDPLIHPDFNKIYAMTKKAGMYVSLFTNGIGFTESSLDLLESLPPVSTEITLYGFDNSSYRKFTGSKFGFSKLMENLSELKKRKINFLLKSNIMNGNRETVKNIKNIAENFGVNYKFGAMVIPGLDGNKDPLRFRLLPDDLVDLEFEDEERKNDWILGVGKREKKIVPNLRCLAGVSSFVINPDKTLSICGVIRKPSIEFKDRDSFKIALKKIKEFRVKVESWYREGECARCDLANFCPGCPGYSLLENGNHSSCITYCRDIVERKMKYITR